MKLELKNERVLMPRSLGPARRIAVADIESVLILKNATRASLEIGLGSGKKIMTPKVAMENAEEIYARLAAIVDPPESRSDTELSLDEIGRRLKAMSAVGEVRASCLARLIFEQALRLGASDVHIEGSAAGANVIFRIDGVLHNAGEISRRPAERLLTHLKVEAGVASYRRDIPQEGRMEHRGTNGETTDLRVSFMPARGSEKAVARIFERRRGEMALDELGFSPHIYAGLMRLLARRNGMILLAGPSASGKTTTIYSALRYLMAGPRVGAQVVTIEDPVECRLPGATQVQVDTRRDMTFSRLLGNLLRQDAEVIAVGEIRDAETASIAVQAALTGQLLLSTLHTGRAPEVVVRLLDLGIEPYRVASSLAGAMSQRLLRKVCDNCREKYSPAPNLIGEYAEYIQGDVAFQRGAGCGKCFGTGYRGRAVVAELLEVDSSWSDILRGRPASSEVMSIALKSGMKPIIQDAVEKACAGQTTLEEIKRVLG